MRGGMNVGSMAFALALLVGCGGGGPGAPSLAPVQGRARLHPLTLAGEAPVVPLDLSQTLIQALVPGEGEGRIFPGYGRPDGTFDIPEAPAGAYWLRVGNSYFWTDARTVDLDQWQPGRPDQAYGAQGTELSLWLDGLAPWSEGTALEWCVANQGLAFPITGLLFETPPLGATALAPARMAWQGLPLLETAKGDEGMLVQLGPRALPNGETAQAVDRWSRVQGVTFHAGSSTPLVSALAVPPQASVRLGWRRSTYAGLSALIHPGAFPYTQMLQVVAHPLGTKEGWTVGAATVFRYRSNQTDSSDLDLGLVPTGQPYPEAWLISNVDHTFAAPFQVDELPGPAATLVKVGVAMRGLPGAEAFAGPSVGPLRNVQIGGRSAFERLRGIGTSPLVRWDPPSLGTVQGVWLQVSEFGIQGGQPYLNPLANLYVSGAQEAKVPPFILRPGHRYLLRLRAYRMEGLDYRTQPFRRYLPYGYADVVSELLEP